MSIDKTALASGAIGAAILEVLHKKGVLSLDECRDVLNIAMTEIGNSIRHDKTGVAIEAQRLVVGLLRDRYAQRAKDEKAGE
jgi:hypothetical protein